MSRRGKGRATRPVQSLRTGLGSNFSECASHKHEYALVEDLEQQQQQQQQQRGLRGGTISNKPLRGQARKARKLE